MSRRITPSTQPRSAARTGKPGTKTTKPVESSVVSNLRRGAQAPRQPKIRKTPARAEPPRSSGKTPKGKEQPTTYRGYKRQTAELLNQREKISAEVVAEARATGMLPHEWMLAVMRGEQISHFAYDAETQEIIEVIVLPTFQDRIECAKAAAPYFANKLPNKPVEGGKHSDPTKQPGVMEVPLVASMEKWTQVAAPQQAMLKREVTK